MSAFDRLDEVRDVARARAREDFEYFANYVMGAKLPVEYCVAVQRSIEQNAPLPSYGSMPAHVIRRAQNAATAWLVLISFGDLQGAHFVRTDTYEWLFGQEAA